MISCSHWGLFSIVECDDPTDMPHIDGVVVLFPKRARPLAALANKRACAGSTE